MKCREAETSRTWVDPDDAPEWTAEMFLTKFPDSEGPQVFLSYDHADEEIVQKLSCVLCAVGIRPWVDVEGLPPGSTQWDSVIRTALQDASSVIAVCSENSRDSHYVAIELEIAKGYQKKIFPVWLSGEIWSQSAPFALVLSQYIDLRPPRRREGINALIRAQKRHLAGLSIDKTIINVKGRTYEAREWPFVPIYWIDKGLLVNPFSHGGWGELLSEVYEKLLEDHFPPFSYGETWALEVHGGAWSEFFALPASWAATPFRKAHEVDAAWVHSAVDLELASSDGFRVYNIAKPDDPFDYGPFGSNRIAFVVDLREKPQDPNQLSQRPENFKNHFIGVRCRCSDFFEFMYSRGAKSMFVGLDRRRQFGDLNSRAFEYFEVPEPRLELVTYGLGRFLPYLDQMTDLIVKRDDHILEFK